MGGIGLKTEIAGAFTKVVAGRGASRGQSLRIRWSICDRPECDQLPLALPLCRRNIGARAKSRKVHCIGLRRVVRLASFHATGTISMPFLVPWGMMP